MSKVFDFVMVGLTSWDFEIGSNALDIARELSKSHRVLYINRPLDMKSLYIKGKKGKPRMDKNEFEYKGLQQTNHNLWVYTPKKSLYSINRLPKSFLHAGMNYLNNRRIGVEIKRAINALDFQNYILINDNDFLHYQYLDHWIRPKKSFYYIRDFLTQDIYFQKHGYLEQDLMKKVDGVLANSTYLAEYSKKINPQSYFVGQGIDYSLFEDFDDTFVPDDIANIPGPIIGYIGMLLQRRLNIDLLIEVAKFHSDKSLVLVGFEDNAFKNSALHELKNVYFLGGKSPEEVPLYINNFDVCINPQVKNQLTIGNYPRKIDEYLILGKPVVATKTEAMEYFRDYTYLGETTEDYISLINVALNEKDENIIDKRIKFAMEHNWSNCIEKIMNVIERMD